MIHEYINIHGLMLHENWLVSSKIGVYKKKGQTDTHIYITPRIIPEC